MYRPLISICIPCHNAEKYLSETLTCLLNQSYHNIEIIIIDDHSLDNSLEIIKFFKQNNPDKILFKIANKTGAAAARNQAFKLSSGEYIIFFDADDLIDAAFIENQLHLLQNKKDGVVISNWGRFTGNPLSFMEDPRQIKKDLNFRDWIVGYWNNATHTTPPGRVMMQRNTVLKAGLWNEDLSLNDDFHFFSRLFSVSSIIKYNPHSIFKYRSNIGGLSSQTKTLANQKSNLQALQAGIELALLIDNSKEVKLACANMLQNFIYSNYPRFNSLTKKAEHQINQLGGSAFPFPSGGYTKLLCRLLGWKTTKLIKSLISHT